MCDTSHKKTFKDMLDTYIISLFDISLMFIEKDTRGERSGLNQKTLKKMCLTDILRPYGVKQ